MISNAKIAQAFKNAVPYLAKNKAHYEGIYGTTEYICFAIEHGNPSKPCSANYISQVGIRARSIVSRRIGSAYTMEDWLRKQGIPYADLTFGRLQKHRHAWLKMLIKEFEGK